MKVLEILCKLFLVAVILLSCNKEELEIVNISKAKEYLENTDILIVETIFHEQVGNLQDVEIRFSTPDTMPEFYDPEEHYWLQMSLINGVGYVANSDYEGNLQPYIDELAHCGQSKSETARAHQLWFEYSPLQGSIKLTLDLSKLQRSGNVQNIFNVLDSDQKIYGSNTDKFEHPLKINSL